MPNLIETVGIINALMDTFFTSREISVLNTAIKITQDCIATNHPTNPMKLLQDLLSFQLALRPLRTALGQRRLRDPPIQMPVSQSQPNVVPEPSIPSPLCEILQQILELIQTFNATGDIDYLEDSIMLSEELIAANFDHQHIQIIRSLMDGLLQRREQVTVGLTAEPMEVLPGSPGVLTDPVTVPPEERAETVDSTASEVMTEVQVPVSRLNQTSDIDPVEEAIRLTEQNPALPNSSEVIQQLPICPTMHLAQPTTVVANETAAHISQPTPQILFYSSQQGNTVDELLEGTKTLIALYSRTDEFEYLEASMELIEEFISGNNPSELTKVLQKLHAVFSTFGPSGIASEPDTEVTNQTDINSVYSDCYETYNILVAELGDVFLDMYGVTSDLYYLEQAIDSVEELIAIREDSEDSEERAYTVELQVYVSFLVSMRPVETTNVPPAQITPVIEQTVQSYYPRVETNIMTDIEIALLHPLKAEPMEVVMKHVVTRVRKFATTGEIWQINEAILITEWMITETPPSTFRWQLLGNIGFYRYLRYINSGCPTDLVKAIQASQEAVERIDPDHPDAIEMWFIRSLVLVREFQRLDRLEDLDHAIHATREAVERITSNSRHRKSVFGIQSWLFWQRYNRLGNTIDLANAIDAAEQELKRTPLDDPTRSISAILFMEMLFTRSTHFGSLDDISRAIKLGEEIITTMPPDDHSRPAVLTMVIMCLALRYTRSSAVEDVERWIKASEEAVASGVGSFTGMGILYCIKYYQSQDPRDFTTAIRVAEEDVERNLTGHPFRGISLTILSNILLDRFGQFGDPADFTKSIDASRQAIVATPDPHERAIASGELAARLLRRFYVSGLEDDFAMAIEASENAVTAISLHHPDRTDILILLSRTYASGFHRFRREEHLTKGFQAGNAALDATHSGHRSRADALARVSELFHCRFELLGDSNDLDCAITCIEDAIAITPSNDRHRSARMGDLGSCFHSRYKLFGALNDNAKAIHASQEALAAHPSNNNNRLTVLGSLSSGLFMRYQRLGGQEDRDNATQMMQDIITASPANDPETPSRLYNLSNWYYASYLQSGSLEELEKAIQTGKQVIASTPSHHPARLFMSLDMSNFLASRYHHSHNRRDLFDAVNAAEYAKISTPPEHPAYSQVLFQLALLNTCPRTSLHLFIQILHCKLSKPSARIRAARLAVDVLISVKRWDVANYLLEYAIKLLPSVCPRFLSRNDQENNLSQITQFAAVAMSVAIQAGAPASQTIGLFELGRGIIQGFTIDCRSDLSELEEKYPTIFYDFDELRTAIDMEIPQGQTYCPREEGFRGLVVGLINKTEEMLVTIRELPGFKEFQRPPTADMLLEMASETGTIIIFNCTTIRSDAIMITHSVIKSLPLPRLVFSEVNIRMGQLAGLVSTGGKRSEYPKKNRELNEILLWLWDVAVEPVLDDLLLGPPVNNSRLPRVWWIGVGALALAPFHAAGDHSTLSCTRNTISRVISSYIPTLKALSYARQKKLELHTTPDSRVLIVTMAITPDTPAIAGTNGSLGTPAKRWKPLGNATLEADEIMTVVKNTTHPIIRLDLPTAAQIQEILPACHVFHFAGHGVSDAQLPSNSHLVLTGDPGKLSVSDISHSRLRNAQIAYLSACHTSHNSSKKLVDESIHITSGFHLAGFSHVLGTLWQANDLGCRRVGVEFYRLLFSCEHQDESSDGHAVVSESFHHAVKMLRKDSLQQPIKWACFIHTGA